MSTWPRQGHRPGSMTTDVWLFFVSRFVRLFAYGFLSVVLALYLSELGFSGTRIGLLLSLTLFGDIAVSLLLTTTADRFGRRRTLVTGAVLMLLAGLAFAASRDFSVLLLAATIGVISPSGNEVGPFLSVEQASLSQIVPDERRTYIFGWYNLVGSLATAIGALVSGLTVQMLHGSGFAMLESYRVVILAYAGGGAVLAILALRLTARVEVPRQSGLSSQAGVRAFLGLHQSKGVVARLAALFALDAFGGGFVIQSILAYWFHIRWNVPVGMLGVIFFGANLLAGVSALTATALASRIGLIRTMVFTHLPSNVLLILVPLMPSAALATAVLLLRFSISQMDVPTRQSYVMAVVCPDERSAAGGVTTVARSVGAAVSPSLATMLMASPALMAAPFIVSGGLKIIYDLLLYRGFAGVKSAAASQDISENVQDGFDGQARATSRRG
jgi:MFS family permease